MILPGPRPTAADRSQTTKRLHTEIHSPASRNLTSPGTAGDPTLFDHEPDELIAFIGSRSLCTECPDGVRGIPFLITPDDRNRGFSEVEIDVSGYEDIFVYTVGRQGSDLFYGAVSSPIYLSRGSSSVTAAAPVYIDPTGVVIDESGEALAGADVEILVGQSATGPFVPIPDGSAAMSPANRQNPITTGDGTFNWEVLAGFYKVRASKAGCVSPSDPASDSVETAVLDLPPGVTGLELQLDCSEATTASLFIDIGLLDDGDVDGSVVFDVVCTSGVGELMNYGLHTLTIGSELEISGLPVGESCSPSVESVSGGLLISPGEWVATRIGARGTSLQLLAGTGTETDELIVDLLVSEVAPPLATETVVDVSCSDGSTFSEIVEVPGRAVLEPVAIGANCTATVSNGPGVAFDADQKRTKVFNFGINDDGIGQPGDAGGVEFGDLFFVVSAPAVEAPAASDDTAVAMVGEDPVFVDVLANDSDPNEDIDADSLMIVGLPTLGEVIVSGTAPSRGVLYSPVLGGDDSFVYQVCDAEGLCDTATVEVTVLEQSDCTIVGSEGPDVLIGTQGDDVICGMAGDDDIRGEAGDDLIFAGSGADVVRGGFGADVIVGGRGADLLIGGGGDDVIRGRRGNDTIRGNSGDDVLRGGRGQDDMSGGAGADLMFGGRHADVLRGGPGDDVLRGRAGTDSLFGNRGNDVLRGGPGYDYGDGGASADECIHVEVTVSCR